MLGHISYGTTIANSDVPPEFTHLLEVPLGHLEAFSGARSADVLELALGAVSAEAVLVVVALIVALTIGVAVAAAGAVVI